jgi:hypothetical protein
MAPWLPVVVVLALVALFTLGCAIIWRVVARRRRRSVKQSREPRGHTGDHKFIAASRLIKRSDLPALRRALQSGLGSNLQDRHGIDLLMVAAASGNVAVGELLIANGADVHRVSSYGWTAVWSALNGGHVRFLKLLLEHGANPSCEWGGKPIEEWVPTYRFTAKKADAIYELLRQYRAAQAG